jgi:isopropylmalate/homocitrate/citramalate synthase
MIAPAVESTDLVMQWLESELSNIGTKVSQKGDYVTVEASVKEIERLLGAEYSVFGIFASTRELQLSNNHSQVWKQGKDSTYSFLQSPNGSQESRRYGTTNHLLWPEAAQVDHL